MEFILILFNLLKMETESKEKHKKLEAHRLSGKTALITGGASGIGKAIINFLLKYTKAKIITLARSFEDKETDRIIYFKCELRMLILLN